MEGKIMPKGFSSWIDTCIYLTVILCLMLIILRKRKGLDEENEENGEVLSRNNEHSVSFILAATTNSA